MSLLHLTQIRNRFDETFSGLLDMTDVAGHAEPQRKVIFYTRSLAAHVLAHLVGLDPQSAAASVTDEAGDGGIDAVHFDEVDKALYLVQTKWSQDAAGTIGEDGMLKFLNGVKKLINADYDSFRVLKADGSYRETRVFKKRDEVQKALRLPGARVRLIIAYTGVNSLAAEPRQVLTNFLAEQNQASELIQATVLRLQEIHGSLDSNAGPMAAPDIQLFQWGVTEQPRQAYFGMVSGAEIANLYETYGNRLFSPNLRVFMGSTPVNDDLVSTAVDRPTEFWYFNNGITALCSKVEKLPWGGNDRALGVFRCSGFSIVNGAQTVGSLHKANAISPAATEQTRVSIRLISLENTQPEVGESITRCTNTQNGIGKKDFAALDPRQLDFQRELRIEGITYAVKSGEHVDDRAKGFEFSEAMTALACAHPDIAHTVTAKREVSRLWEDTSKPPYTQLVSNVHGLFLWKLVRIQRLVESCLKETEEGASGRQALILVHGNRLIERIVMSHVRTTQGPNFTLDQSFNEAGVLATTTAAAHALTQHILDGDNGFAESYPGNIFKNKEKCMALEQAVSAAL